MKIIFLDVDGVLNKLDSPSMFSLGKSKLRRFSRLVHESKAEVIVSSTWRLWGDAYRRLERTLRYRGIKISGVTPYTVVISRGEEIQEWLDQNKFQGKFVILDDCFGKEIPDEFSPELQKHLVHTNGYEGLTDKDIEKALWILS